MCMKLLMVVSGFEEKHFHYELCRSEGDKRKKQTLKHARWQKEGAKGIIKKFHGHP